MLQRLAGSEEILPLPDMTRDCSSKITMEIKKSIETSLSKVCRWITNLASSLHASINLFRILLAASLPSH
jgi:hypothetical protein